MSNTAISKVNIVASNGVFHTTTDNIVAVSFSKLKEFPNDIFSATVYVYLTNDIVAAYDVREKSKEDLEERVAKVVKVVDEIMDIKFGIHSYPVLNGVIKLGPKY